MELSDLIDLSSFRDSAFLSLLEGFEPSRAFWVRLPVFWWNILET